MAISFVGSKTFTHAAITAQSCSLTDLLTEGGASATLLQNDIVIVNFVNGSTVNRTEAEMLVSGYTAAHTDLYQNDSNDANQLVQYKFMGATPDTTVSIPASNATTAGVAVTITALRGVDTVTPLDVTPTTAGAGNTGVANAPAITPVTDGTWIAAFGAAGVAVGAVFTNPAGMSATTNHFRSVTITSTTNDANAGVALKTDWASGEFDPAVFGGSTTTNTGSWTAVTLALRPYIVTASGALAASETGPDVFAATGKVTVKGGLGATEAGGDTFTSSGKVTVKGAAAASEVGADVLASSGKVTVKGALAATESGADVFAASGGDTAVTGTVAATETGSDVFSSAGKVIVRGSLAAVEAGADTAAIAGKVVVKGSVAATEAGADVFAAADAANAGPISWTSPDSAATLLSWTGQDNEPLPPTWAAPTGPTAAPTWTGGTADPPARTYG